MSAQQKGDWHAEAVRRNLRAALRLAGSGDHFHAGRSSRMASEIVDDMLFRDRRGARQLERLANRVAGICYRAQQRELESLRVSQRLHSEAVTRD